MTLKINDAGTLRTMTRGRVMVNGSLRLLSRARYMDDTDTLRLVATFASPLSVAANNIVGTVNSPDPQVVSGISTALPSGGVAPFTYSWVKLSGAFTLSNTSSASVTASQAMTPPQTSTGSIRVTVTDAIGQTATKTVSVTLFIDSGSTGGV